MNERMNDVAHPICPIMMYFEGDEDKCDVKFCNFNTETRSCTEACKIDVKELQKEIDRIKPVKDNLIALQKNLGHGHRGDILLTTQERVDTNQEPIAKDIVNEDHAMKLIYRWNAFEKDGLVDELLKLCEDAKKFLANTVIPMGVNKPGTPLYDIVSRLGSVTQKEKNGINERN